MWSKSRKTLELWHLTVELSTWDDKGRLPGLPNVRKPKMTGKKIKTHHTKSEWVAMECDGYCPVPEMEHARMHALVWERNANWRRIQCELTVFVSSCQVTGNAHDRITKTTGTLEAHQIKYAKTVAQWVYRSRAVVQGSQTSCV